MSGNSVWRGDKSTPAEAMIKSKAISYGFKSVEDYLPGVQKLAKEPTSEQAQLAEAYAAKDHAHFLFGDNKYDQAVMKRYYQGALQAQAHLEQNKDRILGDLEKMAKASGVDWNARAYPDARFKDKDGQPLFQLVTAFEMPHGVENGFVDSVFNKPLNAPPAKQVSSSYLEQLTPKFDGFGMAANEAPKLMNGNRMLPFMERAAAAADPGAELEKAIKEDFAQKLIWAKEHESEFNAQVVKTRELAQEKENGYAQARKAAGREEFRSASESNARYLAADAPVLNIASKLSERRAAAASAPSLAKVSANAP